MSDTNTQTASAPQQSQQQSIDPNTMAVLTQLIQQQQQQQTPAMSMQGQDGQPAVGNAQGQQLHPIQQAQQDAAISSVKKLVSDAVTQGGAHGAAIAQHIYDSSNQPPMSMMQGGVNQQGLQALQRIVPPNQPPSSSGNNAIMPQNNQAMLPPKNPMTAEGFNPQTGQMQEGGFLERGLRGFTQGGPIGLLAGLLGPSLGTQMGGTKEAQVLKAGQPSEIAAPQAQANLAAAQTKTEQANLKAGKPAADVAFVKQNTTALQQEWQNKQKEIQAGIYKTQNDRNIALKQNLLDSRKQVLDQMQSDLEHGPVINRGQRLDIYRKQLDFYDGELQKMNGNLNQKGNSDYISTGTLPDGTRVGKKADGTVEKLPLSGASGSF